MLWFRGATSFNPHDDDRRRYSDISKDFVRSQNEPGNHGRKKWPQKAPQRRGYPRVYAKSAASPPVHIASLTANRAPRPLRFTAVCGVATMLVPSNFLRL
jgi:hypothetical protein